MTFLLLITSLFCMEKDQTFPVSPHEFKMENDQFFSINPDELKNGVLFSKNIERSSIWPTLAKLPTLHPYTNYIPPSSLIALQCQIPEAFKGKVQEAFFHVQNMPEPKELQLIRVHPYTHPQNMLTHQSHNIGVQVTIESIPDYQKMFMGVLQGNVHPGQDVSGKNKILVASPNNGPLKLNWELPQRFLGFYTIEEKKILVLHITLNNVDLFSHIPLFEESNDPFQSFLNYENEEHCKDLQFIKETYTLVFLDIKPTSIEKNNT